MKNKFLIILLICLALTESKIHGQNIYTFAGNGIQGSTGDGGNATLAEINFPQGLAIDATGNIYFSERPGHKIRKITTSGIISTIAGIGTPGFSGDGFSAMSAQLNYPAGIAVDNSGNIYIADASNNRIRKINTSGIISTIAGTGVIGYSGDGGLATAAQISQPHGVAVDNSGNVYIADNGNHCIRMINTSGTITTIAGTGVAGYTGDGGPAASAELNSPTDISIDATGNIFIADWGNHSIRKISVTNTITTVAGTGTAGYSGDGGNAISAQLKAPYGLMVDASGNLYISDAGNARLRKVNSSGIINTIAGNGFAAYSGDGGPANVAGTSAYRSVIDGSGNIYLVDADHMRLRIICVASCLTNINSLTLSNNSHQLFPNPNNGTFVLQMDNEINNGEMLLINSIGQKVHGQKILQGKNNITIHNLASGIYNYIILQDNIQISNGKLTVD